MGSWTLDHTETAEPTRRDFLFIATSAVGGVGAAATLWPFISQ
ncbi:MAG: ubiquinol-cytochrome c reductase iron-sulfur subunit N-terminal domain-containing protein, partial [Longimicrobiales bacterium]